MPTFAIAVGVPLVIVFLVMTATVTIVQAYEWDVIFRIGRLVGAGGQGLLFPIPGTQRTHKIGLPIVTPAAPVDAITRDGVKVSAVVYFRVIDPAEAVVTAPVGFLGNSHRSARAHSQSNRRVAFKTRVNLISAHQGDQP